MYVMAIAIAMGTTHNILHTYEAGELLLTGRFSIVGVGLTHRCIYQSSFLVKKSYAYPEAIHQIIA